MVANKGIVNIINLALSYKLVLVIIIDDIGKNNDTKGDSSHIERNLVHSKNIQSRNNI